MYCKVVKITTDEIIFDNGFSISWDHDQDCCESHYLDFRSVNLSDFEGLVFNLGNNNEFFEKVQGYGIRIRPINGHPVSIPGYGKNNGYYSSDLKVVLKMVFDISECQRIMDPYEDEDEDEDVTKHPDAISVSSIPPTPKSDDTKQWYLSGKLHRDCSPAVYISSAQNHDTSNDVLMELRQNEKSDLSTWKKFLRFLKTRML